MQPTTIFAILSTAAVAFAAPNWPPYSSKEHTTATKDKPTPTPSTVTVTSTATATGAPSNVCSVNQKLACCDTSKADPLGAILGLVCTLDVLGGNCNGEVMCCETNQEGLINVNLQCISL